MKVIQSRIYIAKANEGNIIQDRTSLLVWFLSVLSWKRLGYEIILYTDEITKTEFERLGLAQLYSEVKLIDKTDINEEVFWASTKIVSTKQFMREYPDEEFMISDLDYIPLVDPKEFRKTDTDLVCFYGEYLPMYPPIDVIHLNPEYTIPDFFTGKVDPINTCLLYVQESLLPLMEEYLEIEMNFMTYHYTFESGQISNDLMTFVEQQLFSEYMVSKGISFVFVNPKNKSVFNVNGIHTGPYKSIEKVEYWKWIIWYFKILKEEYPDAYDVIINLKLYSDTKKIITDGEGTYKNKKNKETEIKDFSWDALEYPRAFEDIYDPVWRD